MLVAPSPLRRLPSNHHRLGHLLNPTGPGSEDRDWMRQVWSGIGQWTWNYISRGQAGLTGRPPLEAAIAYERIVCEATRPSHEIMLDYGRP